MPARNAETRNGFVIIGGMLAASFIAVFFIPILFYSSRSSWAKKEPKQVAKAAPVTAKLEPALVPAAN